MEEFSENNCDFIVVASRLKGETYNKVIALKNSGYSILWCTNDCDESRDDDTVCILNERYAEKVLTLIKERI